MKKVACIVKGYPRLSETFIAQEIHALEQAGIDIIIYSLRHPTDKSIHPIHKKISAKVHYLPEYIYQHPIRFIRALLRALFNIKFYKLSLLFLKDLSRDLSTNRCRRFSQALVLANEIDPDRDWLYAHFLHTPASVTRYTSILMNLPWSCSAHAKDIWTTSKWDLKEKLSELQWLVSCTNSNVNYLKSLSRQPEKVELLYHGLDLSRFPDPGSQSPQNDSHENQPLQILSIGRAVNKKGYDVLLNALAQLPQGLNWHFCHIGGGPLLDELKTLAIDLKIDYRIDWLGAQNFQTVLSRYEMADIFVLASRIDEDGDRDGLPNVLMEAMTQAIPCVATNISGIPELITDQVNGCLVEAENSQQLSAAIGELMLNPQLRENLGHKGYETVKQHFSLQANITSLVKKFE